MLESELTPQEYDAAHCLQVVGAGNKCVAFLLLPALVSYPRLLLTCTPRLWSQAHINRPYPTFTPVPPVGGATWRTRLQTWRWQQSVLPTSSSPATPGASLMMKVGAWRMVEECAAVKPTDCSGPPPVHHLNHQTKDCPRLTSRPCCVARSATLLCRRTCSRTWCRATRWVWALLGGARLRAGCGADVGTSDGCLAAGLHMADGLPSPLYHVSCRTCRSSLTRTSSCGTCGATQLGHSTG